MTGAVYALARTAAVLMSYRDTSRSLAITSKALEMSCSHSDMSPDPE